MTTTDLAIPESPTASALALVPEATALVEKICNTTFVPRGYQGKPNELLAAILTGHELGFGPMTAISKIHNIQGRAGLASELMRALPLSRGHHVQVVEASPVKCTVMGWRAGEDKPTDGKTNHFTWTIQMAEKAKLDKKDVWRAYPQAMLLARASADMCRALFPDCLAGISYASEELEDGFVYDEVPATLDADPGATPAAAKANTRKLAPKAAPEPPASAPEPVERTEAADPMAEVDDLDAMADAPPPARAAVPKKAAPRKAQGPPPPIAPDRPASEDDGPRLKPEQVLAMRCGEAGMADDTTRHAFYFAATGGAHRSGKTMPPAVVSDLLEFLDGAIAAGEPVRVEIEADGAVSVMLADEEAFFAVDESLVVAPPDAAAGSPPGEAAEDPSLAWSDTEWQAKFRKKGGLAQVLRWAAAQAADLGVDAPTLKDQLVASEGAMRVALVAWLTEGEG